MVHILYGMAKYWNADIEPGTLKKKEKITTCILMRTLQEASYFICCVYRVKLIKNAFMRTLWWFIYLLGCLIFVCIGEPGKFHGGEGGGWHLGTWAKGKDLEGGRGLHWFELKVVFSHIWYINLPLIYNPNKQFN